MFVVCKGGGGGGTPEKLFNTLREAYAAVTMTGDIVVDTL